MADRIHDGSDKEEELTTEIESWVNLVEFLIEEGFQESKMSRFNAQPRKDEDAAAMCVMVPQEEREQLTPTELNKLKSKATESLNTKFLLLPMKDDEKLLNAYNVAMQVRQGV